uniref:Uncharacterized protein n=1 Tax=Oryza nivara TaxID=4536 RepID=A0A0E0GT75_ORYNI
MIRPGGVHGRCRSRRCRSDEAGVDVDVERRRGIGALVVVGLHDGELHLLRGLPVALPLVDEPVVDLLLLQPRRLGEGDLLHLRRVRPPVMELPPGEQLLPRLLGELPFLPLLRQLLPQASQVAAVLPQQVPLQRFVVGARVDDAEVLVFRGLHHLHAAAVFVFVVVRRIEAGFGFCMPLSSQRY